MLKTLAFIGALAALTPIVAHAQPRWGEGQYQPRYDGYDHRDRSDYEDRDDQGDRRYQPRYPNYGYGYAAVPYVGNHPAYDAYGPDPNGLRAADGHRIKCKLVDQWDGYGQYVRRRACW